MYFKNVVRHIQENLISFGEIDIRLKFVCTLNLNVECFFS